jgi:crotonobetainyl-CoA:carnitine CoA-transferase CaiB-like acyl-CoA transferase
LFDDPHLAASDGLEPVTLENGEETRLPTIPLTMGGKRPAATAKLSEAGFDSRAVLRGLGMNEYQIQTLIDSGAAAY